MRGTALSALAFAMLAASPWSASLRAADIDPAGPEAPVLTMAKALHDNDFKGLFLTLPAEERAQAEKGWKDAATDPASGDGHEFDQLMARLLAPTAVDDLIAQAQPTLATFDPQKASTTIMFASALVPMMLSQGADGKPKPMTPELQKSITMLQGLVNDVAQWLPNAQLKDPAKLRSAIEHLVAGAKAFDIKDTKSLRALPLDEVLAHVGPLVKEVKAALAVYDLQADAFLDSITAKSGNSAVDAGPGVDARMLTVGFTAFGHPYELPLKVEHQGTKWVVSKDNTKAFDSFSRMLPKQAPAEDNVR